VSARAGGDYHADKIIIATGTSRQLAAGSVQHRNIIIAIKFCKSNDPKTMIVVGGGVIGVEYTCMFATLGVRVTLIEKRPRLLNLPIGNG